MWGVALEALVEIGDREQVAALAKDIRSGAFGVEWKDNVVLALLRLGQTQFRNVILEYVQNSMASPGPLTIPLVAAVCRVDRKACLESAAQLFADAHATNRNVDGFIPAFVRNFLAVDEQLLAELVAKLPARQPGAGRWLAERFETHLSKPWMVRELGSTRVSNLCRELGRVVTN